MGLYLTGSSNLPLSARFQCFPREVAPVGMGWRQRVRRNWSGNEQRLVAKRSRYDSRAAALVFAWSGEQNRPHHLTRPMDGRATVRRIRDVNGAPADRALDLPAGKLGFAGKVLAAVRTVEFGFRPGQSGLAHCVEIPHYHEVKII